MFLSPTRNETDCSYGHVEIKNQNRSVNVLPKNPEAVNNSLFFQLVFLRCVCSSVQVENSLDETQLTRCDSKTDSSYICKNCRKLKTTVYNNVPLYEYKSFVENTS